MDWDLVVLRLHSGAGLFGEATAINYVDRQVFGVLGPRRTEEFHWSERDYSFIVSAFTLAYAIGTIVSDTVPRKVVSSVVGIGGTAACLGLLILSTVIGYILDGTQATYGEKDYVIPFIVAGSAHPVATLLIHLLLPRLEPMELETAQAETSTSGAKA